MAEHIQLQPISTHYFQCHGFQSSKMSHLQHRHDSIDFLQDTNIACETLVEPWAHMDGSISYFQY